MAAGPTPPGQRPDHGTRLTQADYESRIAALHASDPASPTREQEQRTREAELSLLIDYKLGVDFPPGRRARLLQEHRSLNRRFLWRLLLSVLAHPRNPSDGLGRTQVRAFARHLDDGELAALLDLSAEDVRRLRG
jgi:hypothetical protein